MKKKLFPALLAAEAAALILPRFFSAQPEAALLSLAALPFAPIGAGLRALSLSGSGGNTAAVALYVLLCLLPLRPCSRSAGGGCTRRTASWPC